MSLKVLTKQGSTVTDISSSVVDYDNLSATLSSIVAANAVYIGQRHPFNHLFFKLSTANSEASVLDLKIWGGTEFIAVAELSDETSLSGATLGQSGFISFVPNKDDAGWQIDDTEDISEISTIKIYDRYWIKLTFSEDLTSSIVLKFIGNLFSNDNDLYSEHPTFNRANIKTAFGVTTWEQQAVRATSVMIDDMVGKGLIKNSGQILERYRLKNAAVKKTAEIIYAAMGDDYEDDRVKARDEYRSRLSRGIYDVDLNANAILDTFETKRVTGFLSR